VANFVQSAALDTISFSKNSILGIVSKMFREEMKELNEEIKEIVEKTGKIVNIDR
jgi:CheY-specific phosphatase CheX